MRKFYFFLFISLLINDIIGQEQSSKMRSLEYQIFALNNQLEYNKSQQLLFEGLKNPALTPEEKFYHYLFLSYTYKRIYDYTKVMEYLQKANSEGNKTIHRDYYNTIFQCEMAYVLFDTHDYNAADSIMNQLAIAKYKYLKPSDKSSLIMQQAYLKFLEKDFKNSEVLYLSAIDIMKEDEPCKLPNIYVKCIQLYGGMRNITKAKDYLNKAIHIADSCQIIKYKIYAYEIMNTVFLEVDSFEASARMRKKHDSLNLIYAREKHSLDMANLELKYNAEINDKIKAKQKLIQNLYAVGFIGTSLIALILFFIGLKLRIQKRKLTKQNVLRQNLVQILSHDIKEPLLSAQILTEKIKMDIDSPKKLATQINSQLGLTKSILKNMVGLIQEDNLKSLGHDDLIKILNNIHEKLKVKLEHKKLKFTIDESVVLSNRIKISEAVLDSLLTNLIINSIKYSFLEGEIIVSFAKNKIFIRDFGSGIPKDIVPTIGLTAVKSKEGTHGERGTGLGLYLVNQMLGETNVTFAFRHIDEGVLVEIMISRSQSKSI
jgi:signal transduction histidine kinase